MAGAPCGGGPTPAGGTTDAESRRETPGRGGRSERSLPEDSGGQVAAVPMRAGIVVTTGSDFRRVPGAVPEAADAEQRRETHRDPGDSGAWRADDGASGGGRRTGRGAPELSSVNLAGETRRNRAARGREARREATTARFRVPPPKQRPGRRTSRPSRPGRSGARGADDGAPRGSIRRRRAELPSRGRDGGRRPRGRPAREIVPGSLRVGSPRCGCGRASR